MSRPSSIGAAASTWLAKMPGLAAIIDGPGASLPISPLQNLPSHYSVPVHGRGSLSSSLCQKPAMAARMAGTAPQAVQRVATAAHSA